MEVELRRLRELLVCVDVRDRRSPSEDFVLRTPVRDLFALVLALALLSRRFVLVAVLFVLQLMIGSTTSFEFVDVMTVTAVPDDRRRLDFRLTGVFLPEDGP